MKKELTRRQQLAVAVAKDVLKQLAGRKLRIRDRGTWVEGKIPAKIRQDEQIQCHLPLVRKHCDVCAKGALFLSYVELKNEVTFEAVGACNHSYRIGEIEWKPQTNVCVFPQKMEEVMVGAFSRGCFDLIETAYEKVVVRNKGKHYTTDNPKKNLTEQEKRAIALGKKHRSPTKRMIAICKNIVKNDGDFVP